MSTKSRYVPVARALGLCPSTSSLLSSIMGRKLSGAAPIGLAGASLVRSQTCGLPVIAPGPCVIEIKEEEEMPDNSDLICVYVRLSPECYDLEAVRLSV